MKKIIYCILAVLTLFSQKAISQVALPDTIVFGSDYNFPPYEFIDNDGKPAGFNIDLIRAIGKEMGFHVKIKLGIWTEIKKELIEEGTVQISDMFYSKERDQLVDYAMPNEVTFDQIFIRKGQEGIVSFKDLKGKKVAIQTATTINDYLQSNFPEIQYLNTKDEPAALKLLSEGKCDAAIVSNSGIGEKLKEYNIRNLISVGHTLLPREHCFVVKEGNTDLLNAINTGLVILKGNQKFDELHKKWFTQKTEFRITKSILFAGLFLVVIILIIIIWNRSLLFAVKIKTNELVFTNSRLRLISSVKATRIDKLSTKEQTIELLKQVKETFDVDACIVRILVKGEMKLLGSIGVNPENLADSIPDQADRRNEILTDTKLNSTNSQTDLTDPEYPFENELANLNYQSFACTQLISEGQTTGILCVYTKRKGREFTKTDLEHLKIVANQIGISIENNRLFEQNEKQKEILVKQIIANKKARVEIEKLNAELEQRVIERTAQLQAANSDLESFSYSISHDLRAPLRAIFGFSQILASRHREALNEEGQKYMDYVVDASVRMEQLINDLLNYSRLGRTSLIIRPVELKDIIQSVLSDFKVELNELGAQITISDEMPTIQGDESLLLQIFSNLVGNSIKYRRKDNNLKISILSELNGNECIVKIVDNGIGIEEKHWNKIFQVFQRLHSEKQYQGTGIGLANVKKAVTLLGGTIEVQSELNAGSTFIIKLLSQK